MCQIANVEGQISNHSLRATSATTIGVPEKVIQECTGHCSLEALRTYERTNEYQHMEASKVLSGHAASTAKHFKVNNEQTSCKIFNIQSCTPLPSKSFNFEGLHGCTINFLSAPSALLPTTSNSYGTTEYEMEQFMSD